MINLLQGSEKRQIRLAELLIHTGEWMTLEELAHQLNCSERTLKYDFKNFQETFSDFTIESSHHGVRLMFDNNKGLKNIYINIFDSSNAFKIIETIFFNETYSVTELAELLYISPSTLYRTIHQINESTQKYGFQIQTNPCKLTGKEEEIRFFYYQFFYEKYTILTWPYQQINCDIIDDLLYFFMDLTDLNADFAYYNVIKLMLFVNLYRYQNEYYVDPDTTNIDLKHILLKLEKKPGNSEYFEKQYQLKINKKFIK